MPETIVRKATRSDLNAVEKIYEDVHTSEETGKQEIGWIRGVYPTRATAQAALDRDDLFVLVCGEETLGAAVINRLQVDVYALGSWQYIVPENEVCVLHTLVISPDVSGRGLGRAFVRFYEEYALSLGCRELRMDTNVRNSAARAMYRGLGYREIGVVPTVFNGIPDVHLVLLEKHLHKKSP